jgi:hypothetical protein
MTYGDDVWLGHCGVRVATGDITGDGVLDIITGAGPTGGPHVRVWDGASHLEYNFGGLAPTGFFAYNGGWLGGIFVASADINGDGRDDIITGTDSTGGPHVKVFDGTDLSLIMDRFVYDPSFAGGVRVAAGDVSGDGRADVVAAQGSGGTSTVRVFSGADVNGPIIRDFTAFANFGGGSFPAVGDLNGDAYADIVVGAGAGGGPLVRAISGNDSSEMAAFYPYDPNFGGGAHVAVGDVTGNGENSIITGPGLGGSSNIRTFDGSGNPLCHYFAYPPNATDGVFVAGAPVAPSIDIDIVTAEGVLDEKLEETPGAVIGLNGSPLELAIGELIGTPSSPAKIYYDISKLKLWRNADKTSFIVSGDEVAENTTIYAEGIAITDPATGALVELQQLAGSRTIADRLRLYVVNVDVISVPEVLFASAEYATPVKFRVDGVSSVFVKGLLGYLYNSDSLLQAFDLSTRFAAGDGNAQNNGSTNTYTAFVRSSEYAGIDLPADHATTIRFELSIGLSTLADIAATADVRSAKDDLQAKPRVFADRDRLAFDIQPSLSSDLHVVPIGEAAPFNSDGTAAYEQFQQGPDWPISGLYEVNVQSTGIGTSLIQIETRLEDHNDLGQEFGVGNGWKNRIYGTARGGYFYVSYGGRDVMVLDPGEKAMDLNKTSGNFDLDMFSTGQARVQTEAAAVEGMNIAGGAANGFNLGWALYGATNPWVGAAFGVAGTVASIISAVDQETGIDDRADGNVLHVLARTPAFADKANGIAEVRELASGQGTFDSGWRTASASVVGRAATVGDQFVNYIVLNSASALVEKGPSAADPYAQYISSSLVQYQTATESDFSTYSVRLRE